MFIFIQNIEFHCWIDFVVWSQKKLNEDSGLWILIWQDYFNRKKYSLRFTLDLNHNFRKFLWIEFESNVESFLIIMCKDFSKISSAIENMLFLSKHKMFIMFIWDVVVWFWLHIEVYNTIGIDSYTTRACVIKLNNHAISRINIQKAYDLLICISWKKPTYKRRIQKRKTAAFTSFE